jgi:hypothetical protein
MIGFFVPDGIKFPDPVLVEICERSTLFLSQGFSPKLFFPNVKNAEYLVCSTLNIFCCGLFHATKLESETNARTTENEMLLTGESGFLLRKLYLLIYNKRAGKLIGNAFPKAIGFHFCPEISNPDPEIGSLKLIVCLDIGILGKEL